MKITNEHNLPANFVRAVEYDAHRKADYSCTELIKPVRIVHLGKRHDAEISDDASERVWLLLGRSVHYILEKSATIDQLEESYIEIPVCGRMISGTSDLYEESRKVADYKITSAWTLVFGSREKEWEEQLNIYAYMFRTIGLPVDSLEIVAILRDWSKTLALKDPKYPQKPVRVIKVKLWPIAQQEGFVNARVDNLIKNESITDDALPCCTAEDRWQKPDTWAVMKHGRKSAVKVCGTEEEAIAEVKGKENYIEYRPGASTRCDKYCLVNKFCNQYSPLNQEVENE